MVTRVSTTAQLTSQVNRLTAQQSLLQDLATQLSTGKKTQTYSGLGSDMLTSVRARASMGSNNVYMSNITNSLRRMELMLNSTSEIRSQGENMSSQLTLLSKESAHQQGDLVTYDNPLTDDVETTRVGYTSATPDTDLQAMQNMAESVYNTVADTINSKDGDRYLLNGADTGTQPFTDTGMLDSAMTKLITDWKAGTISNNDLISALTGNSDELSDTTVGFSAALSADNVGDISLRASDTQEVDYTVRANEDPFRDLIVGLAFLKNADLTPIADVYTPPNAPPSAPDVQGAPGDNVDEMKSNFYYVFDQVASMVDDSLQGIDSIGTRIAVASARAEEIQTQHQESQNVLAATISDVEDVSLDEIAVKISTLQTQLEASYTVTASTNQLSLVNYI